MIPYGCYFGTTMNLFLHFSIFTISLPILIVKRNREHYPRPFSIWILDVSKQMIGYIVLNFRFHMHEDFCVAYFEEIITDGIFLTSLCIIFHILSQKLIRVFQPNRMSRMESGNYTAKWSFISWLLQLGVWLTICIVSKYIVYQLTGLFISHLYYVSSLILLPLRNSSFLEMLFILILIPLVVDMIVLWITDSYLKDTSGLYTHHFCFNCKDKSNPEESETSEDFLRKALTPLLHEKKEIYQKEYIQNNEYDYSPIIHNASEHFNKHKSPNHKLTFQNLFNKVKQSRIFEKREGGSEKENSSETEDEHLFGKSPSCIYNEESKTEFNSLFCKMKDTHDTELASNNSTFELCQTTPKVSFTSSLSVHKEKYPHISKHLPSGGSSSQKKGGNNTDKKNSGKHQEMHDDFSSYFQSSDEKPKNKSFLKIIHEEEKN